MTKKHTDNDISEENYATDELNDKMVFQRMFEAIEDRIRSDTREMERTGA